MRRHRDDPGYNAVGASGATSAVIFAFILLNPLQGLGIIFIPVYIPGFLFGLLYLMVESYMDKRGQTHIAHDAHIYGALFGFFFPMLLDYEFLLNFITSIREYAGI
jgi:membrane associated rhomboid family serine protease